MLKTGPNKLSNLDKKELLYGVSSQKLIILGWLVEYGLNQLSYSINKLADISAKRLKAEADDRTALLRFRKEEAEANRRHEIELAHLYLRQNQNFP